MSEINFSNLNPSWDEERKAVFIPIINKYIDFKNSEKEMKWDEAMAYAKKAGKELPSLHDMFAILFFKDEIGAILKEHSGDFLGGWAWTSTEDGIGHVWLVNFDGESLPVCNKRSFGCVRAVVTTCL